MTADQREQALAALDRFALFFAMNPRRAWDPKPDLALVRVALTPPPLPADLAAYRRDAVKAREWLPDEAIHYGPEHDYLALLADGLEVLVAELAELRARPTLTAEEARNYLNEDQAVSADDWHAAYAKLRAIAEGAGS